MDANAWIGVIAVVVAVVFGLVGLIAYRARKNHVQKQNTFGGTSIQSGRDTKIGRK